MPTLDRAERICGAGMVEGRPRPGWRHVEGNNGWGMQRQWHVDARFLTAPDASSCLGQPPDGKSLRHQTNQLPIPAVGHSVQPQVEDGRGG